MASGWANDDAVNEQINNTIEDAVARARGELLFISSSRNKINGIICFFYKLITPNEWDRRLVSGQDHFPLRVIFL
ncbi:hypothetical protein MJL79_28170, partial [Salmonella enterica subsp. enterica serovar Montevideo]|nr:hypothetical protein [Salmonella enterica subsp. enterica serovar Montevideo]